MTSGMEQSPESLVPDTRGKAFTLFVWRNRVVWFLALFAFAVVTDQASKMWAQGSLTEVRETTRVVHEDGEAVEKKEMRHRPLAPVDIIPNLLSFKYAENPAAAFSLTRQIPAQYRRPLLLIVSFFAMILIGFMYFRTRRPDGLLMTAFALIIGGAMGNFIDRVRFGYVVDFIDVYAGFLNSSWPHWPTFNIADSCIVVGALSVLLRTFRPLYHDDEVAGPTVEKGAEA